MKAVVEYVTRFHPQLHHPVIQGFCAAAFSRYGDDFHHLAELQHITAAYAGVARAANARPLLYVAVGTEISAPAGSEVIEGSEVSEGSEAMEGSTQV